MNKIYYLFRNEKIYLFAFFLCIVSTIMIVYTTIKSIFNGDLLSIFILTYGSIIVIYFDIKLWKLMVS